MNNASEQTAEVQDLTWRMLDEQLDEQGQQRLAALLSQSEEARQEYIRCTALHADLLEHFGQLPDIVELLTSILDPPKPPVAPVVFPPPVDQPTTV